MLKKFLKTRITLSLMLLCGVLMIAGVTAQAQEIPTDEAIIAKGATLFVENQCNTCHAVGRKLVGPALKGINDRRDVPWLISFIKNSSKVIQSGDAYAVALYNEYNKTLMPSHEYLTDDEVIAMLAWVQAEGDKPAEVVTADAGGAAVGGGTGGGMPSEYLTVILVALVIILVLILVVLFLLISVMNRFLKQRSDLSEEDQELVNQKFDVGGFLKSPAVVGLVTMIFVAVMGKVVIDGLYTVGVQQGYQPTQPIAFSHQLHAGQYEIDCQYCHTGVEISASANIPSVNICMNCHSAIQNVGGEPGMSPEIQKLYTAMEEDKPIEWVRIHNLPDLAYFNHSQHVKVGGVECQTCHGPIEEMDVVYQYSSLTMGWCIDCHRNTEIKVENGYYDKLSALHAGAQKTALRVQDIGGLECAKCHY
jgi:cytochrome c551/c552